MVNHLVEANQSITVFHRGQRETEFHSSVDHIHGDYRGLDALAPVLRQLAPEVVVHMVAHDERDALTTIRIFTGVAQRLIAVSSMDVYRAYGRLLGIETGPPDTSPLTEDSPVREVLYPYRAQAKGPDDRAYYYDKIPVERLVMSDLELRGTLLRLPAVYGPGDGQHRLFDYLKRMDDKRPAILLDERKAKWRWSRSYVENAAAAIALAATDIRAAARIYNIGEPDALTETEWVREIGRAAGWQGEIVPVRKELLPAHLREEYDWDHQLAADTGRSRKELGLVEQVSRGEGLRRTIAWQRLNPPLHVDPSSFDYSAENAVLSRL